MSESIEQLATELFRQLQKQQATISCAESCTGGMIAAAITSVAGSSDIFEYGWVTYANAAKHQQLGVASALLDEHGAVSRQVVEAMARGARKHAVADYAVASSGIAGPGGGSAEKPVGTVWLAWALPDDMVVSRCCHFAGDRKAVREQATQAALAGLLELL